MAAGRAVALFRWYKFLRSLLFWQAVWFLYFQSQLSAAEALVLYAIYDIATTLLEVPSGVMSDRLGRRVTLILSAAVALAGMLLLAAGGGFAAFALGQALLGVSMAFASGTEDSYLYETLDDAGRGEEIERESVIAWRYGFAGLMLSAVTGGLIGYVDMALTFWATAAALLLMLGVTLLFREPGSSGMAPAPERRLVETGQLRAAFATPPLRWLFVLAVLMYGYSHLPFVFGQPFILDALGRFGLAAEAPVVSGTVTAVMMAMSLLASLAAPALRARIGLAAILLLAFAIQIGLAALLALSDSLIVIGFLVLRMVPDAISQPFLIARIQPLLQRESRATYLSLQSLVGRIAFATSLWLASFGAADTGAMAHAEIRAILGVYALAGIAALTGLAITRRALGPSR